MPFPGKILHWQFAAQIVTAVDDVYLSKNTTLISTLEIDTAEKVEDEELTDKYFKKNDILRIYASASPQAAIGSFAIECEVIHG